ncbi:hypothetical protein FRACYDRAFT_263309 [Fragilariopsis cylindrus CCMP1102]|uniref:FAS1 domain-containing protein n=1 Tax=Fragilariopsis cylindrus CCMP1102 TaxID=635003 RepID=A0A1E7F0V0_9STRA|nr:hypothetical protein FRACYDRAFT_263309 [Fragilariopsis cylindrus CCMP1102]|eukprot:OEU11757.1 hypothetical protein FRACYDRAFT_263309 [Fragilariopsis cylindrus CCMP1102]
MRIIIPSVLLSALLSITGVQGQVIPICASTDPTNAALQKKENGTIYTLLCGNGPAPFNVANPQFTTFCAALEITKLATTKSILQNVISREVTVFAPVNAAFAFITPENLQDLLTEQDKLARIIELHISDGRLLTSDLDCNREIPAINTQVEIGGTLPRPSVQESRTKCTTAGTSFQIGPGNNVPADWPEIGSPNDLFDRTQFPANPEVPLLSNADVVNNFLQPFPHNNGSKGGKGGKGSKGYYNDSKSSKSRKMGGRALDQNMINETDEDNSTHDRRKRLLESLVEPNGNIEQLD